MSLQLQLLEVVLGEHGRRLERHTDEALRSAHENGLCLRNEHLSLRERHGLLPMHPKAKNSRNYTQCDSLLIGDKCGAHTVPYIECRNNSSRVEHEATTSKVDDDQLFYCRQRGMDEEEAVALVVNGFCKEVLQALPMEFAMEAQALVAISLEGSVG